MNADIRVAPHYRRQWFWLGVGLLVALFVLALQPMPAAVPALWGIDKVLHLIAFMALMLWFCGLFPRTGYLRIFLLLLAYGVAMEIGQSLVPSRFAEFADLVADVAGLAIGWLGARAGLARWPHWVESMVLRLD